ncbi:MAG: hypothetical protein IPM71_02325 [Bacteroidota bacterium]|nr:MAG: hypothetical protein IPM71_02325 [Bacteroidota bacterium]
MKKNEQKVSGGLSDMDELKKQQLAAEVKSLKTQRLLSVLTAIGALIAFMVTNLTEINQLFTGKGSVRVATDEMFVREQGLFTLSHLSDGDYKIIADYRYSDISTKVKTDPGSYRISLQIDSNTLWTGNFSIEKSEDEIISVPRIFDGQMFVTVQNNSPVILPESQVNISVSSSGNGYLWIFEKIDTQNYALRYPPDKEYTSNAISANETFQFPDANQMALFSGSELKMENYVLLVTSVNDWEYAHDLLELVTGGNSISKGTFRQRKLNWGAAHFEITINSLDSN